MKTKTITHGCIITTIYPYEFLFDLLENIRCMKEKFYEIIIVSMGMVKPDLSKYKDLNIINIHFKKILPPGKARNIGIQLSISDYIHFIDDDDLISLDRISNFNKLIKDKNIEIDVLFDNVIEFVPRKPINFAVGCDYSIKWDIKYLTLNKFLLMKYGFLKPIVKREFLLKNHIFHSNFLKRGEDLLFRIEFFFYSKNIFISSKVGYYYRIRPNSLTSKNFHHQNKANYLISLKLLKHNRIFAFFIFKLVSNNHYIKLLFNPFLLMKKLIWRKLIECENLEWR